MTPKHHTPFAEDTSARRLMLPWGRAIEICWRNVLNRRGRFLLIFLSIAVVVAFFVSTLTYEFILAELRQSEEVPVRSALQRANLLTGDADAARTQRDRTVWLLTLSGLLCFVGVCNTMYMSVTERFREIGTLKCLGALDGFIIRLFMIESLFVGLVGSTLGAVMGCVLMVAQLLMVLELEFISPALLLRTIGAGMVLAVFGGALLTVLAAVYPTRAAAKMKPVDAMRVEV